MARTISKKNKVTGITDLDGALLDSKSLASGSNITLIDSFRSGLRKEYDSIMEDADCYIKDFISTGITPLDYLLGGGIPQGAFSEILGLPGVGKSTLALHLMGRVQAQDGIAFLVDTEYGTGSKTRLEQFGVDPRRVIISTEDLAEKAFLQIEQMANYIVQNNMTNQPNICIIDSLAGLTTAAELEADMSQAQVAITARMIKRGVLRVKTIARQANMAILMLNQAKVKIGGVSFGPPEYTSAGGETPKFQAITRLLMEKGSTLGETKMPDGHRIRTKIVKCKTAGSLGRTLPIRFYYDHRGFGVGGTVFDLLNEAKVPGMSGAWKTITGVDGNEVKFQESKIEEVYAAHKDVFDAMVLDVLKSQNFRPDSADFAVSAKELSEGV